MFRALSLKKLKGIFPGYLLAAMSSIMVGWGSVFHAYGVGIFLKPLIDTFGWSRAQVSLGYSFSRLEGGIEGPFGGIATDKWGPRAINLVGFFLFGLGLCGMYFVNSLWMFYLVWLMAAIGGNLGMTGPLDAAFANWFVKRRGTVAGITKAVTALIVGGGIPVATWLLVTSGWRLAFLIGGVSIWIVGLPLTWFFVKPKRPEYYGWLPDGKRVGEEIAADTEATIKAGVEYATETTGEVEFTVRQAMRDKVFWICVFAMSLRGMVLPAVTVHTIPLLTDRGFDPMVASAAMGTSLFMGIPARLLFGWLGDRVRITWLKYTVIGITLVEALAIFILTEATTTAWLWVYIVIYGLGHGGNLVIWIPFRGRYWGRKAYATIQGAMMPFTMVTGIIAPVYAGWVYDTTGSYIGAFRILLICLIVAAAVLFFANPPKPPKKIGKITEVL